MKVKNKRTGEIGIINYYDNCFQVIDAESSLCGNSVLGEYRSLVELCEEWIDYKEPRHWFIDDSRGVSSYVGEPNEFDKEIGNDFESKEKAELAVRKLKAWRRLKERGLEFIGIGGRAIELKYPDDCCNDYRFWEDFNLVFSGEDEECY